MSGDDDDHVRTADPSADGRRSAASRTATGGVGSYRLAARGAITGSRGASSDAAAFYPNCGSLFLFFCRYRIAANRPWNERQGAWYLCSTVEWAIAIQRAVKQPDEIGDKSSSVHLDRSVRCGF